jgi:hypothetical protein
MDRRQPPQTHEVHCVAGRCAGCRVSRVAELTPGAARLWFLQCWSEPGSDVVRDCEIGLHPFQQREDCKASAHTRAHAYDGAARIDSAPIRAPLPTRRSPPPRCSRLVVRPTDHDRTVNRNDVVSVPREKRAKQKVEANMCAASRLEDDGPFRCGTAMKGHNERVRRHSRATRSRSNRASAARLRLRPPVPLTENSSDHLGHSPRRCCFQVRL